MTLFDSLGFDWDRDSVPRDVPRGSLKRVIFRFRRMLPGYVWDAGVLEGNPFTLEWGHFRGEGVETEFTPDVAPGEQGRFTPLRTIPGALELNRVFSEGISALQHDITNPFERAMAFYFFGALQQFFFDGNKRTSRVMMNGVLMSEGIDAISIPAARAQEFNSKMVDFYMTRDATSMMAFIVDCHPGTDQIREVNDSSGDLIDAAESKHPHHEQRFSLQDVRQKARENWLRGYRGNASADGGPVADKGLGSDENEEKDPKRSRPSRAAGLDDDYQE